MIYFTAHTFKCVCHCRRAMFRVLGMYNFDSDLKNFANSRPSSSNFKSFSESLEHFFLTVGQNNFGKKIPFLHERWGDLECWLLHEAKKFLFFLENAVSKFLVVFNLYVMEFIHTTERKQNILTKLFQSIILGIRLF